MAAASLKNVVLTKKKFCANCKVYGWEQPEPEQMKNCSKCKVLSYCSVSCQGEHWALVHKQQCQELASIGKRGKPLDAYMLLDDIGPLQDLVIQADKILLKMSMEVGKSMSKSELDKLDELRNTLLEWRKMILDNKTTYPKGCNFDFDWNIMVKLKVLAEEYNLPTELWSSLQLVLGMLPMCATVDMVMNSLKTPRESVPAEHWVGIPQVVSVLPDRVTDIIKALSVSGDQIPSFQELLRIFCGGALSQTCSFCDQSMTVAAAKAKGRYRWCSTGRYYEAGIPTVDILPFLPPLFICGASACLGQWAEKMDAYNGLQAGLHAACKRLTSSRCDYCFMMAEKVHR